MPLEIQVLVPLMHVVVAVAPRRHADRLQVGAGIGLGQRQAAAHLARGEPGQPVALLRLGAELLDGERQHQVGVEDAGDRHPHRGHAHHDLGVGARRQAEPAIVRADGGAEQAELLHLLDDLRRPAVGVVEFLDPGRHLALHPAVDGGQKLRLVGLVDGVAWPVMESSRRSIMPDGGRWTRPGASGRNALGAPPPVMHHRQGSVTDTREQGMRRRQFAATLGALPFAGRAFAQGDDWPARTVRIVCPFTPGGSQDNIARRLGAKLGEYLGQSFVIDNRSGAGGSIAADNVAKSPPDGYSVLLGNIGSHALVPHLYRQAALQPLHRLRDRGLDRHAAQPAVLPSRLRARHPPQADRRRQGRARQIPVWRLGYRHLADARHGALQAEDRRRPHPRSAIAAPPPRWPTCWRATCRSASPTSIR